MERRCTAELRASARGQPPKLTGYAAIFDSFSEDLGGFREAIRPGAFARSLKSNSIDPVGLVQHMPHLVLGRRSAGTMRLAEDSRGLHFEIDPPDTQAARDLLVSVGRGDIKGCSFGFTTVKDDWQVKAGNAIRTLLDVDLHEISIAATPAYPDTTVALRAFQARHFSARQLRALQRWLATC